MLNQPQSISAALAATSAFPLLKAVAPSLIRSNIPLARSHHKVSRSGRAWELWLQGFQLANGDDALGIALEKLKFAQWIKDVDERSAELDWWSDVVAWLRAMNPRRHR